jgi:ribonuclease-3
MKNKLILPTTIPISDAGLLERALTHRSFANDTIEASNERMEFLGDSVLGMVISEYLFEHYPAWDQGELSKAKASIVMEGALAEASRRLGLDKYIRLGPGEEASGGRQRTSILGDVFEAVIAAIYLSNGIEAARKFVIEQLEPALEKVAQGEIGGDDFKSRLQEISQAQWRKTPTYRVILESGSPHDKTFTVEVIVENDVFGQGSGKSKKEAEQTAAHEAVLKILGGEITQLSEL